MKTTVLNQDNLTNLKLQAQQLDKYKIDIGIQPIKDLLGELSLGKFYCAIAATGVGKSTFLFATAKYIAETIPVAYLTTEEDEIQLIKYLPEPMPNLHIIVSENISLEWQSIKNYLSTNDIHYVFYDYIGSTGDFSWDNLKEEANVLSLYARDTHSIIFTACQATADISEQDPNSELLSTIKFVAFGKHIIDKCSGAFYIIRYGNGLYGRVCKNRDAAMNPKPVALTLCHENRTWRLYNENSNNSTFKYYEPPMVRNYDERFR